MFKKIVFGFIILFILLLGSVLAIPFLFKDKINALIKEQLNKEILVDLEYGDYDLSIIKIFPDLYFSLEDISLVGRDQFEGDTLAAIKELGLGIELMKFVRGEELLINSVLIDNPRILAYQVYDDLSGDTLANYNIMASSSSSSSSSDLIDIHVDELKIIGAKVYYKDFISGMELILDDFNILSSANYVGDVAEVKSVLNAAAFSFNDGSMQYLKDVKLAADIDVEADLAKDAYVLKENMLSLNDLVLHADGEVQLVDSLTTYMDLTFSAEQSDFKSLLSLIPEAYLKDYAGLQASGDFSFNGMAKGELSEVHTPAFDLNLKVNQGSLQYPDLPSAIKNINLDANLVNIGSTLKNTNLTIPKASFNVLNEDIVMRLTALDVLGDPNLDLELKGATDLKRVPEFYPLEGYSQLAGNVAADILFKGKLSDVEKEAYEKLDFSGNVVVDNFIVEGDDLAMLLKAKKINLDFSPQKANLLLSEGQLGASDFSAEGSLENLVNYVFSDGILKGDLKLVSNTLNLDELLGSDEETNSETSEESTATKVPANIDFTANLKANKVLYDGLELNQVLGALSIKDEQLSLNNLSANLLGGSAKISGSYSTKNSDKPELDLAYDIQKFDIQQTFNYLNSVQALAPMAKYLNGSFSTDMSLSSFLNNDLSIDLKALNGLGTVKIPYASFNELPMFQKISETIKIPAFNKPALNNAWTILKFEDGKVNVEPFEVKMQDISMNIEGSNGFDQSIDYNVRLNVPSDKFGGAASIANDFLAKQKIPLLNLSVPQSLNFDLNVSGLMSSPVVKIVKVSANNSTSSVKDQVKDAVKDQIDKAKEDLQNKAQEEADKAKQQAQEELDKAKQKAQEEADKLKEDLKENVKDKIKGFKW
ncbi:MAG: AsmA-like C-terminal region-containing protein [Chitinophagales bacterium]